jgi:hypothetical protein
MSGCENLLVNKENRNIKAVFEKLLRTVRGEVCFEDGGTPLVRRLRRVIRKLPILGDEPGASRLNHYSKTRYNIALPYRRNSGGRSHALPLDIYLSWKSHFCYNLLYTNQVCTVKYVLECVTFFNLLRYAQEKMGLFPPPNTKRPVKTYLPQAWV